MRVRLLWSGLSVGVRGRAHERHGCARVRAGARRARPWGDPDIQGTYTNTYENGTPLERPDQFAGRKLEDVKGEELARIEKSRSRTGRSAISQGPIHAPDNWWQDNLDLHRGSQAWLVVDPPDGKIPPMTPEAQRRITEARRGAQGQRTRTG